MQYAHIEAHQAHSERTVAGSHMKSGRAVDLNITAVSTLALAAYERAARHHRVVFDDDLVLCGVKRHVNQVDSQQCAPDARKC